MGLEQEYARGPFAKMINQMPGYFWCSNRNINPKFYIKGSPDGYIAPEGISKCRHTIDVGFQAAIMGKQVTGVEFKSASSANYSSLDLSCWSDDQELYWRENILKKHSNLFVVSPDAWIAMRIAAGERKTVALTPGLERVEANRNLTLLPNWEPYRLVPTGSTYVIPETHPLHSQLI